MPTRDRQIAMLQSWVSHAAHCHRMEMDTRASLIRMRRLPLLLATFVGGAFTQLDYDVVPRGLFRLVFPCVLLALALLACSAFQLLNIGFRDSRVWRFLGLPIRHTPRMHGTFDGKGIADVSMSPGDFDPKLGVRGTLNQVLKRLVKGTIVSFEDNEREREVIRVANVRLVQGVTVAMAVSLELVVFSKGGHVRPATEDFAKAVWARAESGPGVLFHATDFLVGLFESADDLTESGELVDHP